MIQHEFEELLEQFSQDELNEKSTVKGQFTSYITRRMEWHAIRYAAKNRPNVIVISLDQAPRHLTDIDAEQMFRKVEIELALQQEVQRLLYITLQNVASTADVLRRAVMPFVSRREKK